MPQGAGALTGFRECRQEPLGPAIDIVCHQVGEHSRVPLLALIKRHFERGSDRLRHGLDFVRVDDQSTVELSRSPREPGQHARFMPSRSGVTRPICAERKSPANEARE